MQKGNMRIPLRDLGKGANEGKWLLHPGRVNNGPAFSIIPQYIV